ncbi:MAG: hypothetical protein K6E59_02895 [Bacilli bacterium]|nr:hypothetical protein [Bacilli bacterium]
MDRVWEGIFAYADGDGLCRYGEGLSSEQIALLKEPGVGRYIGLSDFDAAKGFYYRDEGETYLTGEKGEPSSEYSGKGYAHRILPQGHVFEVHVLRDSVKNDPSFTRGTKEMDHFLLCEEAPSLPVSALFRSGPLTKENDLPKWGFDQSEGAKLPVFSEDAFAVPPLPFAAYAKDKDAFLDFAVAFIQAQEKKLPLLCLYEVGEEETFASFLFRFLDLFPSSFGLALPFSTLASGNDGSSVLGVPVGKGNVDKGLLRRIYGEVHALRFPLMGQDAPLDEPILELIRHILSSEEAFVSYRSSIFGEEAEVRDVASLRTFASGYLFAKSLSGKEDEDVFEKARRQEAFLDGLIAEPERLIGLPASTLKDVRENMKTLNVAADPDFGSLDLSTRIRLLQKAVSVHQSVYDASLRLASLRHLDEFVFPQNLEQIPDDSPYLEMLSALLRTDEEFLSGTYYPHVYLDASLGKRAYRLCEAGVKEGSWEFAEGYVAFLSTRLPTSKPALLRFGELLSEGSSVDNLFRVLFETGGSKEEETVSIACEMLASAQTQNGKAIEEALLKRYAGEGVHRLLSLLEKAPVGRWKDELQKRALEEYLGVLSSPEVASSAVSLAHLAALEKTKWGVQAEDILDPWMADIRLLSSAKALSLEDFIAFGASALQSCILYLEKKGHIKEKDALLLVYEDLKQKEEESGKAQRNLDGLESQRLRFCCDMMRTLPRKDIRAILAKHLGKEGFLDAYKKEKGSQDERLDALILRVENGSLPLSDMDRWWEFGKDVYEAKGKKRFNLANVSYAFRNLFLSVVVALIAFAGSAFVGSLCYVFWMNNTYYLLFLGIALLTALAGFGVTYANCFDAKSRFRIIWASALETAGIGVLLLGLFMGIFMFIP